MSHHLTQPEEIDQVLMSMEESGVEGKPALPPLEVFHDCDGSIGATAPDPTNRHFNLNAHNSGEPS
jgi:hypothetical protein